MPAKTNTGGFVPKAKEAPEVKPNEDPVAEAEAQVEASMPTQAQVPVAAPVVDPNAIREADLSLDVDEAAIQQKQLLAELLARDKQRKEAPEGVQVARTYVDKRAIKVAMWREQGLIADDEGVMFDCKAEHARHLGEGWTPVIIRGRHATDGSDLAYKRDKRISELIRKEARIKARTMLAGVGDEMASADPGREVLTENNTAYSPEEWEKRGG